MKKINKKAFTLIELLVVIAVIGILVLIASPKLLNYTQKAELAAIQSDVKVMQGKVNKELISDDKLLNEWDNIDTDELIILAEGGSLYEVKGKVNPENVNTNNSKIVPSEFKNEINTKLKGTFYANNDGKVYYEHVKPLVGAPTPTESEKRPVYSDEEIQNLINQGYIPITTAEELSNVRNTTIETYGKGTQWEKEYTGGLNKKYVQVANIDLSEYGNWTPIGTYVAHNASSRFRGTYDGGNYVITGLETKGEGKNYQGLFGYADGATISNVALEDINVTGGGSVGGLVGNAGSNSTIENSYATGSVVGTGERVGGLVGNAQNSTKISNSYATGSVESSGWYVGGLVGFAHSITISNSYATGSVTGRSRVGGFVGNAQQSTEISNSYATGSVQGSGDDVGGLVGMASNIVIENSYATGSVEGSGNYVGGLVGEDFYDVTTIRNSYWDTETTGQEESAGGTGKTTKEMKTADTYSAWDTDVWNIVNGNYPTLR